MLVDEGVKVWENSKKHVYQVMYPLHFLFKNRETILFSVNNKLNYFVH